MVTTYANGPACKVFRDVDEVIRVYNNIGREHVQVRIASKPEDWQPYVNIPWSLCKEVGMEIYALGCSRGE